MPETPQETHSGQSAHEVHLTLKAALKSMAEAEKCAVICFGEIMERKLYRELGYSSINQYAAVELGFSSRRTGDFVMLCKRMSELPLVKEKVASGKLGYTAARVIVPVVDQTNEKDWVDFATTHSRRETEREVKRAKMEVAETAKGQQSLMPVHKERPVAVVPVRVSLEMTPTQFSRYEALWEQIRKQGGVPADRVEALLEIMQSGTTQISPRGQKPPVQIYIHHCEECDKATVQTGKGELEIGTAELEQAQCDCQISRPGERNTTSVPPATRREILAKYRHKCQRQGCGHTRYLEVHHKIPRSQGGGNELDNLICLCSVCHKLLHDKKLAGKTGWVKSPEPVYEWHFGATLASPCPPVGHVSVTRTPFIGYGRCFFNDLGYAAFQQGSF